VKRYETLYIVPSALTFEEAREVALKYRTFTEERGAEIERLEDMGQRKLAYEINGHFDGRYVLMVYRAPSSVPAELGHQMRLDEKVVRHITIVETKAMKRAAQAKARAEAEAAAAEAAPEAGAEAAEAMSVEASQESAEEPEPEAEADGADDLDESDAGDEGEEGEQ